MAGAANFAWANRQMMTHEVRRSWKNIFGEAGGELDILYDVAHNIAKIEEYFIEGKHKKVIMHRKGATRAFGPGHKDVIEEYRESGQPVLIPGSMGSSSFVLAGTAESSKEAFGSSCHGAGRRMSRHEAKREIVGSELKQELESKGIHMGIGSIEGLAEEAPQAYKDVKQVVDVVHGAGIARKIAELKPVAVIKG
jgi:tRNA-splicing ligase RtcB